jgi:hypothetical protein
MAPKASQAPGQEAPAANAATSHKTSPTPSSARRTPGCSRSTTQIAGLHTPRDVVRSISPCLQKKKTPAHS